MIDEREFVDKLWEFTDKGAHDCINLNGIYYGNMSSIAYLALKMGGNDNDADDITRPWVK